jgi:hypothetical protein
MPSLSGGGRSGCFVAMTASKASSDRFTALLHREHPADTRTPRSGTAPDYGMHPKTDRDGLTQGLTYATKSQRGALILTPVGGGRAAGYQKCAEGLNPPAAPPTNRVWAVRK